MPQGIATGLATLERSRRRTGTTSIARTAPDGRFVARRAGDGAVVGWVALVAVLPPARVRRGRLGERLRRAPRRRGQGIGRALLEHLIAASDDAGLWTLLAGVLADNAASLAAPRAAGFRRRRRPGALGQDATGRWRDVVLLERRRADR